MVVIKFTDDTIRGYGQVERFSVYGDNFYLEYVNEIRKYMNDDTDSFCSMTELVEYKIKDIDYIMVDGKKVYERYEEE